MENLSERVQKLIRRVPTGEFRVSESDRIAINEILNTGAITEGKKVFEFEKKWSEYIGTKYSIVLNSGTSALIAGLNALKLHSKYKLQEKTNVITTPISFIATSNAIMLSNLNPVYVDIDPNTFVITPENIKTYLESSKENNSLILPVHLMGYACDMNKINEIAKEYNIPIFEDASQAHGTIYDDKKTGSLSLLSAYSFYIAHNIQGGEMGAVNSDDLELVQLIKQIKTNGRICNCMVCSRREGRCAKKIGQNSIEPRFHHSIVGYNFKTTEFSAVFALNQMRDIGKIIKARQENVKKLNEGLSSLSDKLQLPLFSDKVSYLGYPLIIKNGMNREKLLFELEQRGVETRPLFGCIPTQQPAYAHFKEKYKDKLPVAEHIGKNGFYIGCHQYLCDEDIAYVIKNFKEILA